MLEDRRRRDNQSGVLVSGASLHTVCKSRIGNVRRGGQGEHTRDKPEDAGSGVLDGEGDVTVEMSADPGIGVNEAAREFFLEGIAETPGVYNMKVTLSDNSGNDQFREIVTIPLALNSLEYDGGGMVSHKIATNIYVNMQTTGGYSRELGLLNVV